MAEGVELEIKFLNIDDDDVPEGATSFLVNVQALIGEVGHRACDSFDVHVASLDRLARYYEDSETWCEESIEGQAIVPLNDWWLMRTWSRTAVEEAVRRVIDAAHPGEDVGVVANRIGRLMPWEFHYVWDRRVNEKAGLPDTRGGLWGE